MTCHGDSCSTAKSLIVWVACPAELQPLLHSGCFSHFFYFCCTYLWCLSAHKPLLLQVNRDGSIESLPSHEHFPDFPDARVLGKKVGALPDILTT